MKFLAKYFFIFFVATNAFTLAAQEGGLSSKGPVVKTRISVAPVIGLYKSNKNHTSGAKQKMAYSVSIKEEIRLDKKHRSYLMVGGDYLYHGLSFNSYYFFDDSIHFYNKQMNAKYNLVVHEVNVPIQFKYSLQKETNAIFSSYVFGGYAFRYLAANNLTVEYNGTTMKNGSTDLSFKIPTFTKQMSSFINAGIGFQKNSQKTNQNAVFAELQFKYALSPLYINETFAPSSLYISNHFLLLSVGVKI